MVLGVRCDVVLDTMRLRRLAVNGWISLTACSTHHHLFLAGRPSPIPYSFALNLVLQELPVPLPPDQLVSKTTLNGNLYLSLRLFPSPCLNQALLCLQHPFKRSNTHPGNHAQALSYAARKNGIKAYIVMPTISPPPKIAATRGYGATIIFSGSTSVEREAVTEKVIADTGARLVPPYDHADIVLGQGTLGLELQEQVLELGGKGLDAIIAPCGGGGMLSGVALSAEGTGIRVFGSEPEMGGADDGMRGYYSGERVERVSSLTIADGLRTPVGKIPWGIIYERRLVAGMYNATEEEIRDALRFVYERMKVVVEPSAAVPLAVALYNEDFRRMVEREAGEGEWSLGVVFSGGNVSLEALGELFAK